MKHHKLDRKVKEAFIEEGFRFYQRFGNHFEIYQKDDTMIIYDARYDRETDRFEVKHNGNQ